MVIAELEEVSFLSNIKCGGENTARVLCKSGEWAASLDGGLISIRNNKKGGVCLVPLTNVSFMVPKAPAAAEAKPVVKK